MEVINLLNLNYSSSLGSIREGKLTVKSVKPNLEGEDIPYTFDLNDIDAQGIQRFLIRMFADCAKRKVLGAKTRDEVVAELSAFSDSILAGKIERVPSRQSDPIAVRTRFFAEQDLKLGGHYDKRGIKPSSKEGIELTKKYMLKYADRLLTQVAASMKMADSLEIELDI